MSARLPKLILALAGLLGLAVWAVAGEGGEVYTDPANAGPDYPIQGEYRGRMGETRLGVQVIALGKGAFQAVFHPGGLPGAGWDGKTRVRVDGKRDGAAVVFGKEGEGWSGRIEDGAFHAAGPEGLKLRLRRVERKSPTLGAPAPEGAVVLFDGTNTDHWQGGQMTEDKLLKVGTRTKESFQDFTLHFEFRTPFQPTARGQGRGNSGLFLQDRYEVQILDSFGLDGKDNECGGFYSQKAPSVNMCFPPLTWQTYDIDFEQARFDDQGKKIKPATATVRHNGVVIHDKYELPGPGPVGKKEDNTGGVFQVQNHSNPVVVRNVWLVAKK
jgi:hypothetical protein